MPFEDRPTTKRTRMGFAVVSWVLLSPLLVWLRYAMGWWSLLLVAVFAWRTYDYVRKGDVYSIVDDAVNHHDRTREDAGSRIGADH